MRILNQDRDRGYNVVDTGYEAHYVDGTLWGWRVIGISPKGRRYMLGYYDTDTEVKQISGEIKRLIAIGSELYKMPELVEEIEAEEEIERLEARFTC